ncbi:Flp pilus assembly protein CpaB [Rhizobium rhizosphaerae]|uniref:Flp pilus assembly protein CpaB n=1 Tax=Xaviernesmea rhizosphaerae TaxID=1672749 RepID=A0A1Q9AQ82_9HYPH|nr:Flp pilus assembly protein CpaB [Xaviernesmea rhizosphaerae]OLP57539.1 Flp pilus assembly protein CpaB [Xaviernesmea rhizosphaerae]OQP83848.1 Flp pilus assembly protein CpaB [Xaviernesmea rhizosphaerae]
MKPVRIIIMAIAVASAGTAGMLALNLKGTQTVISEKVVERAPTTQVLVSSRSLPVGARLTGADLRWMQWPKDGVIDGFITQDGRPGAITDLTGAVVRLPIFSGEPLRAEKIADSSSRILSSLLPAGKRAVSTNITVATGAGGFILPNDRVDVIMVRKNEGSTYSTETVLSNIRVLAIDQQIEEARDGTKSVVGTTATLELTPDQAKVINVAQQMAERLSLALRSLADAQEPDTAAAEYLINGGDRHAVQVIKSGTIVTTDQTTTASTAR